jgi:hypothetical protein
LLERGKELAGRGGRRGEGLQERVEKGDRAGQGEVVEGLETFLGK